MARAGVETLGDRIKSLRRHAGLTATQAGELAGLKGRGHVASFERGATGITGGTLARLADVFGVSLDWLYRGLGEAPTKLAVKKAVALARVRRAAEDARA
jgi:transcriptional regulator with XRE-family HTH domain